MKYDYEPFINDYIFLKYPLAYDTFKEDSQQMFYECMHEDSPTNSESYDLWDENESLKLDLIFENDYNLLTENKKYFYGCSFEIYKDTYNDRLTSFLNVFPDASEIDFCEYELAKNASYYISVFTKQKIEFSIKKRNEFLNNKKGQLLNYPLNIETESTTEPEQKLPYKIALLNELGFFKLDAIKKLTKENQYKIISTLTGGTHRTIKGNVNVLDPNSNEDRIKYTSNNYIDEVKNYLDKLK